MLTIEKLRDYGADVDRGLSRCANNEALYLRLVGLILNELAEDALGEALKEGDLDKAFDAAHKLKGAVNNLSLTPIAEPLGALTELLRNKTPGDYDALYAQMQTKTGELAALAAENEFSNFFEFFVLKY